VATTSPNSWSSLWPPPPRDEFETFGRDWYPRLVGTLVVCGFTPVAAVALVQATVRRAVRGGFAGGSDACRLLAEEVLERAGRARAAGQVVAPHLIQAGDDPVAAAAAAQPLRERLATVAAQALGLRSRAARPEVLAFALGARAPWEPDDGRPLLSRVVLAAVDRHAPVPDPDLLGRELSRRRRSLVIVGIALAVAMVVAVIVVAAVATRSSSSSSSSSDGAAAAATQGITEWVAVLDVGPSAFALYPGVQALEPVVGPYVFTDRWVCYTGFPSDGVEAATAAAATAAGGGGGDWFLGLGATDRSQLDRVIAAAGRAPLLEARVTQSCAPPPPDHAGTIVVNP
jgi:hypothetical protein